MSSEKTEKGLLGTFYYQYGTFDTPPWRGVSFFNGAHQLRQTLSILNDAHQRYQTLSSLEANYN